MKNKFSVLLLAITMSIVSCKNEKTTDKETVKVEQDNSFKVVMDLIVEQDDSFQIYYNEDGTNDFSPENYVNVDIKGKPEHQEIVFKLPEDVLPKQLRFDIGSNKEQKEMKIIAFKMEYLDKKFEAKDTLFWNYFGNNTSIKYIREKAIVVPLPNNTEGYDPIFGGTETLSQELTKMVQE